MRQVSGKHLGDRTRLKLALVPDTAQKGKLKLEDSRTEKVEESSQVDEIAGGALFSFCPQPLPLGSIACITYQSSRN